MKRRLLIVAVFLLAGAVVNVAVAWRFAVWVAPFGPSPLISGGTWLDSAHLWMTHIDPGPGYAQVTSIVDLIEESRRQSGRAIRWAGPAADAIPQWSSLEKPRPTPGVHFESAFGWPWLALTYEGAVKRPSSARRGAQEIYGGIVLSQPALGAPDRPLRVLPLRPLWRGALANTVFYSAGLWLVWYLKILRPFTLLRRLRIKRGRCPACGYPMGESAVCSECGKALPGRMVVTT